MKIYKMYIGQNTVTIVARHEVQLYIIFLFIMSFVFKESSGKQKLPSSYILELIVIGKWGDAGKPENFNLCIGFYNVLNAIAHYERLKYAWTVNYNFNYIRWV